MQVDGLLAADPLVYADPWTQTPLVGALTASGTYQVWPGWPTGKVLLQMQQPTMQSSKPACVSQSVPCSNACSRSTSAVSHCGEGRLGSSEGLKRKMSKTPPISRAGAVATK
eukprot:4386609-Karenia_brevis.AAC.1